MVHPDLEPFVQLAQQFPEPFPPVTTPQERRAKYREGAIAILGEMSHVAERIDGQMTLEGRTLATRLYVPIDDEKKAIVLYLHGGSFYVGDLDTHEGVCRRICADTKMKVLALDYRLAPEFPFPAGLNDTVEAVRFLSQNLAAYGAAGEKIIVMGDSAGGTLAAVACALTKDEDLNIAAQVLVYPTLGPELLTNSAHTYGKGYLLDYDQLQYDYAMYLGETSDHTDPRISPLLFGDLEGAPPAVVVVAECDPLRDEGVSYAGLLEHFGVPVELLEAEGMLHGFIRMGGIVPECMKIVDDLAEHMHRYVEAS